MLADDDRVSRLGPHDFRLGTKRTAEYKRYTISCPFHPNCHRKRNAGPPQCAEFGRWGPVGYYLMAWLALGEHPNAATHRIATRCLLPTQSASGCSDMIAWIIESLVICK